jgi:Ca-activated chloride channel homolog
MRGLLHPRAIALIALVALLGTVVPAEAQRQRLPRPERLDAGVELRRDRKTGELLYRRGPEAAAAEAEAADIRVRVGLVEINVHVAAPAGEDLPALSADDFRITEDGAVQEIVHFDASTAPASVALVIDASPSIYRELARMKEAAQALAAELAARDEVAVVAFDAYAYMLLPFTSDRARLEAAVDSVRIATSPAGPRGSHIYEAVYLAAEELFPGRRGRKAIVLLTDGQDSGLGLGWSPASMLPRPTAPDELSFEDLCRALAAAGVELHVVSTMPRPAALTDEWLAEHRDRTLISRQASALEIPNYTLYLAELVRRVGGRLYFLREPAALEEIYREIARRLRAQFTLGYYPAAGTAQPGWRTVRVTLPGRPEFAVTHRFAYYVPAM